MFAVPGWSVSASSLKTQTQLITDTKSKPEAVGADGSAEKSKKRKRSGKDKAAPTPAVTDANVGDLWSKHFEGKKEPKKDKKRQKTDAEDTFPGSKDAPVGNAKAGADEENEVDGAAASKKGKDKKSRKQKQKDGAAKTDDAAATSKAEDVASTVPPPAMQLPANSKLTPMQSAMRQKLISARFRHLNETLYTAPSGTSLALFADNPEMFDDYHSGFRQQVTTWPENPVDSFIRVLQQRGANRPANQNKLFRDKKRGKESKEPEPSTPGVQPLPRTHGTCKIADLGCGDARLAQDLKADGSAQKYNLGIQSYDLQSKSSVVTKADIANLPLADGSMDVAIFCLALMGTNWIDFIEEAYRILHWKGELWIAEIKSRFGRVGGDKGRNKVVEHSVGSKRKLAAKQKVDEVNRKKKNEDEDEEALMVEVDGVQTKTEETDVSGFVEVLRRRGFVLKDEKAVDLSNRMFVKMEFIKAAAPIVGKNVQEKKEEKTGGESATWKKKAKFLEEDRKEVSVEDEAKTLKPCLYKIR
ncbi:hypothetical protein MBLNU459_g6519t1 [Dothideomycetes sp. NU459]